MSGQSAREKRALMSIVHSGDAPDRRARHADGLDIPVGETFGVPEIALDYDTAALILWALVCAAAFVTGYSIGGIIAEWVVR